MISLLISTIRREWNPIRCPIRIRGATLPYPRRGTSQETRGKCLTQPTARMESTGSKQGDYGQADMQETTLRHAAVILSVPCCQHQLNGQMKNDLMAPIFRYGILKERMAALYTDGLRAEILENQGYRTQLLEFIDMEHTPKNILIRAVRQGQGKNNKKEIQAIMDFLHVEPELAKLLKLT